MTVGEAMAVDAAPDAEKPQEVSTGISPGAHRDSEGQEEQRAAKRLKVGEPSAQEANLDHSAPANSTKPTGKDNVPSANKNGHVDGRVKGVAAIKKEFLVDISNLRLAGDGEPPVDDDAAEGRGPNERGDARDARDARDDRDRGRKSKGEKKKNRGQNTERDYGKFDDAIKLCNSRAFTSEFSPGDCRFGDRCNLCHDLRKYLAEGRREDSGNFGGQCPVFEAHGRCPSGWRCRFVRSHMREVEHEDGRKELVLTNRTAGAKDDETCNQQDGAQKIEGDADNDAKPNKAGGDAKADETEDGRPGVYNAVSNTHKFQLSRKRLDFSKADKYITWLNAETKVKERIHQRREADKEEADEENRAQFTDPPFKPSEKRRLYFGPETPALAPLTTQGNLPFRRLCVELGAQLTYSEMAMGLPMLQGSKSDWTLMKAHESEISPPKFTPAPNLVFDGYDNTRDLKFGAQISAHAHWIAIKTADAINRFCPQVRLIDINCGCPIDMVFKAGAGSALLDQPAKLERIIRGMNAVSGEVPITAKIRTGVRNSRPTATALIGRLAFGSRENRERLGAPGCAAVTLHGRSREMRYTKSADWGYIAECGALIRTYNEQKHQAQDTVAEPDPSTLANAASSGAGAGSGEPRMFFLGNGDCYSHVDYYEHLEKARVDTIMIGRGALIKPWLFEEIEKGQYLDKSSTERLAYIEKFVRYGMDTWGTDELGLGFTRRFLLEWLSFAQRYIPIGLLEYLPPSMNDRPPQYYGRNELETLMASDNYKDWMKISDMFLGPAPPNFKFQPKHKSNSYEAEG